MVRPKIASSPRIEFSNCSGVGDARRTPDDPPPREQPQRLAHAVLNTHDMAVAQGLVFVSGQLPVTPEGVRLVIGRRLARLGLTLEKLAAVEASFKRNDGKALVGAKAVDFASVPVFVATGLTKVGYGRFLAWMAAATRWLPRRRCGCSGDWQ